ncbi:MAG: CDP-alcohol phosphatidyltransferase family protein [Phycisphaerae bacterium]|nr:CDP-alcohol phosphatidyltransferase family protein [Phycisphaerae bacterium]
MEGATGDFRRFKEEGYRPGTSRRIGQGFCDARDAIARVLIALRVTPNMLTIAGFLATCGAAVCFFLGGSYAHATTRELGLPPYMFIAAAFLFLASAFDMLDGAVARLGNLSTPLGAVLDSSVDRFSDMIVYVGLTGHFVLKQNLTYSVLAVVAMGNAFLVSYVKARSENTISSCAVGYWMRGERSAALLIAACAGTIPAVLWQQAVLPAFTVLRRMVWTWQVLSAQVARRPTPSAAPASGWTGLLKPWRYPRGSVPYDLVTGVNILFIIFASHVSPLFGPGVDPLRSLANLLRWPSL